MGVRRAADAESFRLHFQRLALDSLLASAEAEAERHARKGHSFRARRAEQEVARLRLLVSSLSPHPPLVPRDERGRAAGADGLRERISAYTVATAGQPASVRSKRVAAAHDDSPAALQRLPQAPGGLRAGRRWLVVLALAWLACAFALAASLLVNGIDSTQTAVAETTFLPLTFALFLVYIEAGPAAAGMREATEIAASGFSGVTDAEPTGERRSSLDRRQHRPDTREHPVERRSGRDRRHSHQPRVAIPLTDG